MPAEAKSPAEPTRGARSNGESSPGDSHDPASVRVGAREETRSKMLFTWAAGLRIDEIPDRIQVYACSQILSHLAAVRATLTHPLGEALVRAFGPPLQEDPKDAAYVCAALSLALEYDDSMYAGHLSHSTVGTSLAYARALGLDGPELLGCVVVANECAARVAGASTLGRFRGQIASHLHLCGAVVARLRAEAAEPQQWLSALGLAFLCPPWTLTPAFLGSDAKALGAAVAVRVGLDACDAAAAGLRGRADILDCPDGFLREFSDVPLAQTLTSGLGRRWHTESLTFKPYPISTGAHSSVECAARLHAALAGTRKEEALAEVSAQEIVEVRVATNLLSLRADASARAYVHGPGSPVAALQYSLPYCVATALLSGELTPRDFTVPAVEEVERWELAARVRVEHDRELSEQAVAATAPLGEALREAGEERARGWVMDVGGEEARGLADGLGPPSETFEAATKAVGARVTVRLRDGRELSEQRVSAQGMAGPRTRCEHAPLVARKYLATGGSYATVRDVEGLCAGGDIDSLLRRAFG